MRPVKTFEGWQNSTAKTLSEYLQIGDLVDTEMRDYFINVLPPATMTTRCIQMGEPYSHIGSRATYSTLARVADGWEYRGHCFRGEIEEPNYDPNR